MQATVKLLKHQKEFVLSRKPHTGLVGGFGSGKSDGGVKKTTLKKLEYPNIDVAYYLPTYPLIKDIAFPKFAECLSNLQIPFTLNKTDKEFITPYGRIIMRSMDNPYMIVGYEVGYSCIDEADILPMNKMQDAVVSIAARNRSKLPNGDENLLDMVSTPEGFKFLYDFFIRKESDRKLIIKAKTSDNPFLPSGYIETLKEIYSPQQLEAYLNGEFVNLTSGTVYNDFERGKNKTDRIVQDNDRLFIGMDFNVTKMAAIVHVLDGSSPRAVDEFIDYYDTQSICNAINAKYPNHQKIVFPDASGQNRNSSGKTDIQILKANGFNVLVPKKNPFVRDRVNTMNKEFRTGNYLVNLAACPRYVEALEQQAYDNNGVPDKSSGHDHANDAGSYYVVYVFGRNNKGIIL